MSTASVPAPPSPPPPHAPLCRVAIGMQNDEAARCLLGAGPTVAVLAAIAAGGVTARHLYADFIIARCPLVSAEWRMVPQLCPGLGRALPAAFAHSGQQAQQVVQRLPAEDGQRLRTLGLCLARLQRLLGLPLPGEVCGRMLALFDA